MKILKLLYLTVTNGYHRWAIREINPLHPDVPKIVRRRAEIEDALAQLGF